MFLKVLLSVLLLDFCNTSVVIKSDLDLVKNVIPHSYSIQLNPYSYNGVNLTFVGNSTILFQVFQPSNYLIIHKGRYILMHKWYTKVISAQNGHIYDVTGQWWYPFNDHYVIELKEELQTGNYTLMLRWNNDFSENKKIFRIVSHDISSNYRYLILSFQNKNKKFEKSKYFCFSYFFIGTKNLRLSTARNLFPCWDEPIFRANFEISIEHPKNFTALSNMPIERNITTSKDNYLTYFQKTPLLSPHSISFAITNYPVISTKLKTISMYSIKQDQASFISYAINLNSILRTFLNYIVISYPLPKIDSVIISGNEDGCISNPGLIFYR